MIDIIKDLTQKQRDFTLLLFEGLSQREAYSRVYDVANSVETTIDAAASRCASNVKVVAYLEALNRRPEAQATYTLQQRKDRLKLIAEENNPSNTEGGYNRQGCIAAIDIINKMEKVYEGEPIDIGKIIIELREIPAQVKQPIDIEAKQIAAPAIDEPGAENKGG